MNFLNDHERAQLKLQHKQERDGRVGDTLTGKIIVEIKSVSALASIHESQLLSYLKLADCKIGLLVNFNVKYLKEGIRRMKL